MSEAIANAVVSTGGTRPAVKAFPWWFITLLSLMKSTFRELREMRYLWKQPIRMDNSRLLAVLGREPHTPLPEAVQKTLEGMGCLSTESDKHGVNAHAQKSM